MSVLLEYRGGVSPPGVPARASFTAMALKEARIRIPVAIHVGCVGISWE